MHSISDKKQYALICVALNTMHFGCSSFIFSRLDGPHSTSIWLGNEHYLHHALNKYFEQRRGWFVGLTPPGIPGAKLAESHTKKTKILAEC